ncbi:MAG TPA: hypothetical protein VGE97_05160 [Nitrososphaera sp.]
MRTLILLLATLSAALVPLLPGAMGQEQQPQQEAQALINAMYSTFDWNSQFVTRNNDAIIAVFVGPTDQAHQPQKNEIDQIAGLYGFQTLAYNYTARVGLIVILMNVQEPPITSPQSPTPSPPPATTPSATEISPVVLRTIPTATAVTSMQSDLYSQR